MNQADYLIIGGGIAGTTAAETIRSNDETSSIIILTEEPDRLYSRVLLPHYLRDENTLESVYLRKPESYSAKSIELKTEVKVTSLQTSSKTVKTSAGDFNYKKLLLASGGKVNKLTNPGNDLDGVFYLRTIRDAAQIREKISHSQEAVVLGGGFIGIEFAQTFIKHRLKTTVIIREKSFWDSVVGENSGKLLGLILEKHGVELISNSLVKEFVGSEKLESIRIEDGRAFKADIAGVGIGIHLDLDYLVGSEIVTKKGVVTNEFFETSVPDIWSAGDLAEFYDKTTHKYQSLGNWANASGQGRLVGQNMSIEKSAFETSGMYSINVFENNFSFLGDPVVDQDTVVVERGTVESGKLARILFTGKRIAGVSLINMPLERNIFSRFIKEQKEISDPNKLSDPQVDLTTL